MLAVTSTAPWSSSIGASMRRGDPRRDLDRVRRAAPAPGAARRTRRRRAGRRCPSGARRSSSRSAICASTASPAAWPPVSLISLKRSRSTKIRPVDARTLGERQRLGEAVDQQVAVGQTGQRVVGCLLGQRGLSELELAHAFGLRSTETVDLTLLRVLLGQIGEGEAEEVVAVDVEHRGVDPHRDPRVRRRRSAQLRSWLAARGSLIACSAACRRRRRAATRSVSR